MYPKSFLDLFPPFPREDTVFVAMSFAPAFQPRWEQVLEPAITSIEVNGVAQKALRVDARRISDSIVTEILQGVSRSRLVLADISTVEYLPDPEPQPIRNANVMYEVGLAHAVRLAEEVVLFRSDDDRLLFDLSNIRVNRYDPDGDPSAARARVSETIIAALRELDLQRHLAVRDVAEGLGYPAWMVLAEAQQESGVRHPSTRTMGEALGSASRSAAITRLLDLRAIRMEFRALAKETMAELGDQPGENLVRYKSTQFGEAVFKYAAQRLGLFEPEVMRALASE